MPKLILPLPDVYESVSRRVLKDAVVQLATLMWFPETTTVLLPGFAETVPMNGGSFGDCCDTNVRFPASTHFTVTVVESADELQTLTTHPMRKEWAPIWHDEARDIEVRPVYRYTTVTLNVEITTQNITLIKRWLDEARSRISRGGAELYFDLQYHYTIPDPLVAIWQEVHRRIQASPLPIEEDATAYVNQHFKVADTQITTLIGTDQRRAIPEHQYEVLGWFDFTTTPNDPERATEENGAMRSSFTYTFHYAQPVQLYVHYPLLVNQQLVEAQYRPQKPYKTYKTHTRRVSTTKGSFDAQRALMDAPLHPYLQLPKIDDWIPSNVNRGTLTFVNALCAFTPENLTELLDLASFGEFGFDPEFIDYFQDQGTKLFSKSESVFEFRLYEHDTLVSREAFYLDGSVLHTSYPVDLTKVYHIQVALKRNWYVLTRETSQCLRRYPYVAYFTLRALGVVLQGREYEDLRLLGVGVTRPESLVCPGSRDPSGTIPNEDMSRAVEETDTISDQYIDGKRIGPLTVMFGEIISRKLHTLEESL